MEKKIEIELGIEDEKWIIKEWKREGVEEI